MPCLWTLLFLAGLATSTPQSQKAFRLGSSRYFDIQAHRGGRGNTVESTIPSFAWGLIDGATTLELDNGLTKDGVLVVWHDESITPQKCRDGPPRPDDPDFPYVGKFVANLTLQQLKSLDCGSQRQRDFPAQLTYPGTKISTLEEVFEFVECADPTNRIQFNIESKINAEFPDRTRSVKDFVQKQHEIFARSPYRHSITYQSFDWRSLIAMKALDSSIITSALIDLESAVTIDNSTSPWLAGLRLDSFPGQTLGEQIAEAAHFLGADILSPEASSNISNPDPADEGYTPFATLEMVQKAHDLGMLVKPWTVNHLNVAEIMLDWDVDGLITDYPGTLRRWAQQQGFAVAPKYSKKRVLDCMARHLSST
ncbi:PLC-like phosphodiesterase [Mycena floridula]|nr:PLC-like phosphodiesterase [Mycena floridula]